MTGQAITFDGIDIFEGKEYISTPVIHIWRQYNPRDSVIGVALHGQSGELLEHKGARCKVRVEQPDSSMVEGFVTEWFIKELKGAWLDKRRKGQA